jgi:carboxyl-terminal processing protease
MLKKLLSERHLEARSVDDQFSKDLFNNFFHELDRDGVYFTATELSALEKYRTLLDNQLNGQGWTFLEQVTPLYKKSLERALAIVQKQSETPFTVSAKLKITRDTAVAPDESELQKRWRRKLHYNTFENLVGFPSTGLTASQLFAKNEPAARTRAKNTLTRAVNRTLTYKAGLDAYVAEKFLESIANIYDPHTNYYNISNIEIFKALLSAEGFYFGISLKENEHGGIVVASLSPGGPAWKSGAFALQDELVSLMWENEDPIDREDLTLETANEILDENNPASLTFTLRKGDGKTVSVPLKKEKLSQEQNLARSYLLEGKSGKRIGYIILPDFYSDWDADEEFNSARCANDVAKEILKLKQEKIDGLILDVRYNGGGSLKEAISLSGIFLEEGAMGMMRHRSLPPSTLKDMNRGTLYDGPMVLMVNNYSASASEFLAAALQDYHRAVIVGSRTFGKATGQEVLLLNPAAKASDLVLKENFGFAKVTTSRTYRVTGRSLQGYGVIPDVALPEFLEIYNYHESQRPYTLKPDSLAKKSYYKPLQVLPVHQLKEKSTARVASVSSFQTLLKAMDWYRISITARDQEIDWAKFYGTADQERKISLELTQSMNVHVQSFTPRTATADLQRLGLDPFAKSFHESSIQSMEKDIYLEEAFNVINDLITINKK